MADEAGMFVQTHFNYRLSRTRRVIGCSFGELTKTLSVLNKAMEVTAGKG
jgi:predicted transcriptional regulator